MEQPRFLGVLGILVISIGWIVTIIWGLSISFYQPTPIIILITLIIYFSKEKATEGFQIVLIGAYLLLPYFKEMFSFLKENEKSILLTISLVELVLNLSIILHIIYHKKQKEREIEDDDIDS